MGVNANPPRGNRNPPIPSRPRREDLKPGLLLDGNGDGLYTKTFQDGLFVDLDDDLHFDVDQMSEGFGSLRMPFQRGRGIYEVVDVAPQGRYVVLNRLAEAEPLVFARQGLRRISH